MICNSFYNSLIIQDRWCCGAFREVMLSYTVTIVRELTWADSKVVLDKWSSYRSGLTVESKTKINTNFLPNWFCKNDATAAPVDT